MPFILNKLLDLPNAAAKYEEVKNLINEQVKQVRQAKENIINVRNNVSNRIRSLRKNRSLDDIQQEPEEIVKNSETVTSAVKHIVTSGASSILPSREKKPNMMLRSDKINLLPQSEQSEESE